MVLSRWRVGGYVAPFLVEGRFVGPDVVGIADAAAAQQHVLAERFIEDGPIDGDEIVGGQDQVDHVANLFGATALAASVASVVHGQLDHHRATDLDRRGDGSGDDLEIGLALLCHGRCCHHDFQRMRIGPARPAHRQRRRIGPRRCIGMLRARFCARRFVAEIPLPAGDLTARLICKRYRQRRLTAYRIGSKGGHRSRRWCRIYGDRHAQDVSAEFVSIIHIRANGDRGHRNGSLRLRREGR